ncbi:MAG: hypothetical protein NC244_14120 [Alistipes senegalensis]|nr:hypothetical protein [Alistipes senegalensis]
MTDRNIRRVKDRILDCSNRLELVQALILYRMDIFTTGVYSERVCLSEEVLELSEELLDSLVNDFRLLVESGFVEDDDISEFELDDVPDYPEDDDE